MARPDRSDEIHLEAAQGWLGSGNWREANHELDQITSILRAYADVLKIRWEVCAKAKEWELALEVANTLAVENSHDPFGFLKAGYALYQLGKLQEAHDALESVLGRFPENAGIRYDLACYCCKLGKLKVAASYLERAIELAGKYELRQKALNDPALKKLWVDVGDI